WRDLVQMFLHMDPSRIDVVNSSDEYILMLEASERSAIWLYVDKGTLLPGKYRNVLKISDLGLEQTLEVRYQYDHDMSDIPATTFNLQRYMDLGYEFSASQGKHLRNSDHNLIERDVASMIMD